MENPEETAGNTRLLADKWIFELISDDDVNGTTTHKDAIVAIKTKYPKG
jgi:hypothetical protein